MSRLIIFLLLTWSTSSDGLWCDRTPAGVTHPKTPGDGGFRISISGDPLRYIPGAVYSVRLEGYGDTALEDKFSGFLLLAEPTDGQSPDASGGNFHLRSDSMARFSEFCPHAVKHASELSKSEVQVMWIAPVAAAGCVHFKATIIKNKALWFMDDEGLTKQFCPETEEGVDPAETQLCCACDEAKYELSFEGQWSALTHPKDYPADTWSAHFSDLIGGSHSPNFRFWENGGVASEGIRLVAELGDSRELESELKDQSGNIRTIIKARGLKHPNFFGHKTFAVFRTDKEHPLVSLVSKIAPSPDWFLGVSGLNLCLPNCSWVDLKEMALFPWDSGTDSGNTYLAPKEPTIPRDRIRRIVWNIDKESPFYDQDGNMKPFARLRLQKLRSYERACEAVRGGGGGVLGAPEEEELEDDDEAEDQDRAECAVRPWSPWSGCSATCGKGMQKRFRQYIYESKARVLGCNRKLVAQQTCYAPTTCRENNPYAPSSSGSSWGSSHHHQNKFGRGRGGGGALEPETREVCMVGDWSSWSTCSVSCGQGVRFRTRRFLNPVADRYNCQVKLREMDSCFGQFPDCSDSGQGQVEPGCETTRWSEWGPCSSTCGKGVQTRTRMYKDSTIDHRKCNLELLQSQTCEGIKAECTTPEDMKDICMLGKEAGKCTDGFNRWYFDSDHLQCRKFIYTGCKGNKNNFQTETECEASCGAFKEIQIEPHQPDPLPKYTPYGRHRKHPSTSSRGMMTPYESARIPPYHPSSPMSGPPSSSSSSSSLYYNDGPIVDCVTSEWSAWSRCSVTCGRGHKYRTRYIQVFNSNGGAPCPRLEQRRKCKGTSCPPNHPYRFQQDFYDFRDEEN